MGFVESSPLHHITMDGEIYVSDEQRKQILNLDETGLSLDGSKGRMSGRPAGTIVTKGVSRSGTATNKSGGSKTVNGGSNAYGEPMPPVLILSSAAQEENKSVQFAWVSGLPKVDVCFGRVGIHTLDM